MGFSMGSSLVRSALQAALDGLMVGRTSVVIAHRLSTIRKADSIAVINKVSRRGLSFRSGKTCTGIR